ncbi:MAG: hypothetical protein MUE44_00180 [Oscillatoriaceae cyanobacterium Prado104]|nr:hypothetical protein [Oscillatoriaceae cyanobacterium Prado104]
MLKNTEFVPETRFLRVVQDVSATNLLRSERSDIRSLDSLKLNKKEIFC